MEEKKLNKFLELKGIPEGTHSHYYISFDKDTFTFVNQPLDTTSLGVIPTSLLQKILMMQNADNPQDARNPAHIRMKVGRQGETSGFGARHILSVENHIHFIDKHIKATTSTSSEFMSLVKFLIKLKLGELDQKNPRTYVIALEKDFQRFVIALKTPSLGNYNHILIVLFPDGPDFIIGTLYPIDFGLFQKVQQGNDRYVPISSQPNTISILKSVKKPIQSPSSAESLTSEVTKNLNAKEQSPPMEDSKTYQHVAEKLKAKPALQLEPKYVTKLDDLVNDRVVDPSESYFLFKLSNPTIYERQAYKLIVSMHGQQNKLHIKVFESLATYQKVLNYQEEIRQEIKKFLEIKSLNKDFNITKLNIQTVVVSKLILRFYNDIQELGKDFQKYTSDFDSLMKNLSYCIDTTKLFTLIQENFSDVFDYKKRDNKSYWKSAHNKLKTITEEKLNIPEVSAWEKSFSVYSETILIPEYREVKEKYHDIQQLYRFLCEKFKVISNAQDVINVMLLKAVNNILKIFIDTSGGEQFYNVDFPALAAGCQENSESFIYSCKQQNEPNLFQTFCDSFAKYQMVLISKNKYLIT